MRFPPAHTSSHPDYREVPVVAIQAKSLIVEQAAVAAGCVACFTAPLDRRRLFTLIRDFAPVASAVG